jgi:hypothetical protein
VLRVVHHWRDVTWNVQDAACVTRTPYEWRADRHSSSLADRWRIARLWYERSQRAYSPSCQAAYSSGVPAWFTAAMPCLATREEYGPPWEGGYTTSAGYFGMISPPSAYPGSAGIVATYGDSWMGIPWDAQIAIVYAEWQAYGSSPWPNTAPYCGM